MPSAMGLNGHGSRRDDAEKNMVRDNRGCDIIGAWINRCKQTPGRKGDIIT